MKITVAELKSIIQEEKTQALKEANPDGTISADEDDLREDLMASVEMEIDSLIDYINTQANDIGGPFRAPGIKRQALRLLADKIRMAR